MGSQAELTGPDLAAGIDGGQLTDKLLGHAHGEPVLLVRVGEQIRAVGATCTHYGAPLVDGLVVGDTVRCPWHHACFDLASGAARGPAIAPLACFDVDTGGGRIRVGAKQTITRTKLAMPGRIVIVGGGVAGVACAESLRTRGHIGAITIVTNEGSDPVDRPNLSKDYLAGNAPEEWVYLRTTDALRDHEISVVPGSVTTIDQAATTIALADGTSLAYDALVLATGAEPIRLNIPGAQLPHVHVLRSLSDSKAIAEHATAGTEVVVIGASFIGLEAAASLTARGAKVTVVGPESVPLARVLGDEVGAFVRAVHEGKGVAFQLGRKPAAITASHVELDDGSKLPAALVVMGVGVKPRVDIAERSGLAVDRGIVVDDQLRAAPNIWVAGDAARRAGVRIEHFQVAVRHGQDVAASILGHAVTPSVPFFWSAHHDVTLGYVGHAETFDRPVVVGSLAGGDAHVVYRTNGEIVAVVTIGRDKLGLDVEAAMERGDRAALEALVA